MGVEAGGECRKRERRKAARRQDSSARPRLTRTLVGQCAFRRSASLFSREAMLRSFCFVAACEQTSGADDAPRERLS
jgi:hypothetical protein